MQQMTTEITKNAFSVVNVLPDSFGDGAKSKKHLTSAQMVGGENPTNSVKNPYK